MIQIMLSCLVSYNLGDLEWEKFKFFSA